MAVQGFPIYAPLGWGVIISRRWNWNGQGLSPAYPTMSSTMLPSRISSTIGNADCLWWKGWLRWLVNRGDVHWSIGLSDVRSPFFLCAEHWGWNTSQALRADNSTGMTSLVFAVSRRHRQRSSDILVLCLLSKGFFRAEAFGQSFRIHSHVYCTSRDTCICT